MSRLTSVRGSNNRGDRDRGSVEVNPWRVGVIFTVLVLVSAGFVWKLVDLQLSPDDDLLNNVGSYLREEKIDASRGNVVDRQGRLLAFSVPRPSIVGDPRGIAHSENPVDVDDIVAELATVLGTDPGVMATRLRSDKSFVYLERQVEPEVGEAVAALGLPGIWIMTEQYREHPNGSCSALSVVGRVDTEQVGISGLEKKYDEQLEGSPGRALRQTQLGGAVQIPDGYHVVEPHTPGEELRLSIDRNIQYEAEQLLARALRETEGTTAIAIVSNPLTGEIYAMASALRDEETGEVECSNANLGAVWTYEPGSTMKGITFAGVFDNGAWGVDEIVEVPATVYVARESDVESHAYHDYRLAHGTTVENLPSTILGHSSNTGTVLLAQELGADALQQTFENFGFGQLTGLAFPGESPGILDELDSHSLLLSNTAIGQSIAVTPLQLIQAYNTLANGGVSIAPKLVLDREPDGSAANPAHTETRVVSPQSAQAVMEMLRGVVSSGTGRRAALPGFLVAGKTGTAWQPCGDVSGYLCSEEDEEEERHYTASFVGIVENDRGPVLSAIVVIDDPQGENYTGGAVAAPVFAELAGYSVRQLHLAPFGEQTVAAQRIRSDPAVAPLALEPQESQESVQ
ncbi:MAG: penicillin-binding protein 2 [Acidimicrobiaceae bacterium]|nr:penicillin-binding protein 2 [Acidimicrobiaceae bacterium]MXW61566.1 penicillin-binding protein 2 [Acidimicrobiaceae bacterium]MYC42210.1 penicillin-binding protein 2 [Acidimicrobiaceae bacterium]